MTCGAPDRIRTCGLCLRRAGLWALFAECSGVVRDFSHKIDLVSSCIVGETWAAA